MFLFTQLSLCCCVKCVDDATIYDLQATVAGLVDTSASDHSHYPSSLFTFTCRWVGDQLIAIPTVTCFFFTRLFEYLKLGMLKWDVDSRIQHTRLYFWSKFGLIWMIWWIVIEFNSKSHRQVPPQLPSIKFNIKSPNHFKWIKMKD